MKAFEIAKAEAARLAAKAAEKKQIEEANRRHQEEQKAKLEQYAHKTLQAFDGVNGMKQVGVQLMRVGVTAAVTVNWHRWEFQGSDESPVQVMEGYVFKWKVEEYRNGEINISNTPESFDKEFGRAMARHL